MRYWSRIGPADVQAVVQLMPSVVESSTSLVSVSSEMIGASWVTESSGLKSLGMCTNVSPHSAEAGELPELMNVLVACQCLPACLTMVPCR